MSTPVINPLNDFALYAKLQKINEQTGVRTALTSGSVTAFLATSDAPTATAADASLVVTPTHVADGKWLIFFDASVLQPALLETLFADTTPVLILQHEDGVRVYRTCAYAASREAQ